MGPFAVLGYLILGGLGCPFFAGGASGWAVFQKPSAGFLFAFLPTAWLAGWLAEKGWCRTFLGCLGLFFVSTFLLLLLGDAWLIQFLGFQKTLRSGLIDLLPGAVFKIFLGAGLAWFFEKMGWRA